MQNMELYTHIALIVAEEVIFNLQLRLYPWNYQRWNELSARRIVKSELVNMWSK